MGQFSEAFYVDAKKVKSGTPEEHFNWSRQIQTNCALTALNYPNPQTISIPDFQPCPGQPA